MSSAHLISDLDTALVVDPVAVSAEDNLPAGVAVEAVPVVPLEGQHVFSR